MGLDFSNPELRSVESTLELAKSSLKMCEDQGITDLVFTIEYNGTVMRVDNTIFGVRTNDDGHKTGSFILRLEPLDLVALVTRGKFMMGDHNVKEDSGDTN